MVQLKIPVYYFDDNDNKIGPFFKKELYTLAERGIVGPETRITDDSIEIKAKAIKKLKFYAPEYHRAEEIFSTDNINRIALQQTQRNNTKETSKTINIEQIIRHPLVVTAFLLIAITAFTSTVNCYILVSAVMSTQKLTKELENTQMPELPEIEIAHPIEFQRINAQDAHQIPLDISAPLQRQPEAAQRPLNQNQPRIQTETNRNSNR